jgi:hypothetical protein
MRARVVVEGRDELGLSLSGHRMGMALIDSPSAAVSVPLQAKMQRNMNKLDSLVEKMLLTSRLDNPNTSLGAPEALDLMGLAASECEPVSFSPSTRASDGVRGLGFGQAHALCHGSSMACVAVPPYLTRAACFVVKIPAFKAMPSITKPTCRLKRAEPPNHAPACAKCGLG